MLRSDDGVDIVDKVGAGEMQAFLGNFRRFEAEQGFGFSAEIGFDLLPLAMVAISKSPL